MPRATEMLRTRSWMAATIGWLVMAFFVLTLLVPTTFVNKAVFGAIAAIALMRLASRPADTPLATMSPVIASCIFIYGFVLSLLGHSDTALARQLVLSVSVLFLIYPVLWYDIDLDSIAKTSGIMLTLFTALFFVAATTSQVSGFGGAVLEFYVRHNLGFKAERDYFDAPLQAFQIGTVPFLLLPLALFADAVIRRRGVTDILGLLAVAVTIAVSGSRGLMLLSFAAVGAVALFRARNVSRVALLVLAIPAIVFTVGLLASTTSVFSAQEVSNAIKIGHVRSFVDNLSGRGIVFGEGLGAYYFSSGRGSQVALTEITPLDMLRSFGFFITPLLYSALLLPTMNLGRYLGDRVLAVALFLIYLVLSLTNPVLFDSAGLLIVVWYWQKILSPLAATARAEPVRGRTRVTAPQ